MTITENWSKRIGRQRDWAWRGWQTRYTYLRSSQKHDPSKPPLILIHGFGAAIEHWRNNIPVLSQSHTVYALDLVGFGASRKVATDYTVNLWVEQLYDFWRTFIGQPVVLVGNSIGSLVCMTAAATYPHMVEGIVMLSLPDVSILRQETLPKWLQPIVMGIENAIASPPLLKAIFKILRHPEVVRRWVKIAYVNRAAITDELVQILAAPAQDKGAARTFHRLFKSVRLPQFSPPAKEVLPTLNIPILLVWGRQDCMVPFAIAPSVASLNPKIEFVPLDNVGHCPHDESPDQFNAILLDWLEANFNQAKAVERIESKCFKSVIEEAS
ncbi:MAG: alpha/beta fold hydrolase [Hydrococcus sp. C42_A2020_068]|nr:alpha/beta fold hydrolase [Hydrococcus sp. C42_A2020_068]